jgi:hypothetical protein
MQRRLAVVTWHWLRLRERERAISSSAFASGARLSHDGVLCWDTNCCYAW